MIEEKFEKSLFIKAGTGKYQGKYLSTVSCLLLRYTVDPRLSGHRLSGLFLWSRFFHEY